MITRKEVAALYNCKYSKISQLLKKFGIGNRSKGKGNRPTLLPNEFETLKKHIGEPINPGISRR